MNMILRPFARAYGGFRRLVSLGQSPLLLLVRLYWGWQFMQTGWGKLQHLPHVVQFFASLGLPAPNLMAPFIAGVEFAGGALLILGLASRLTALVLAVDMLAAYITADRAALLAILSDPGKFYAAAPYTFLFASLLVLVFGPGLFALDTWIAKRCAAHESGPERGARPLHKSAA
jgi:putative oxidoreductase